jgi:hypothetical protein
MEVSGGSKKQEVGEGCRKLHNETLHDSYYSPNIMRLSSHGI